MLAMSLYQKSGEPNSWPGSSDASGRSTTKMEGKACTGARRESKRRKDMFREGERGTDLREVKRKEGRIRGWAEPEGV